MTLVDFLDGVSIFHDSEVGAVETVQDEPQVLLLDDREREVRRSVIRSSSRVSTSAGSTSPTSRLLSSSHRSGIALHLAEASWPQEGRHLGWDLLRGQVDELETVLPSDHQREIPTLQPTSIDGDLPEPPT